VVIVEAYVHHLVVLVEVLVEAFALKQPVAAALTRTSTGHAEAGGRVAYILMGALEATWRGGHVSPAAVARQRRVQAS
jgi:hypothetical protein